MMAGKVLTAKGRTYEALRDMSRFFPLLLLPLLSPLCLAQDASRFEKEWYLIT